MLGVLTIYAGGKVATAFLVLGVPLTDDGVQIGVGGSGRRYFRAWNDDGTSGNGFLAHSLVGGALRFCWYKAAGSGKCYDGTETDIADGAWHHVVAVYDGSGNHNGISFYVDGELDAVSANSAAASASRSGSKISPTHSAASITPSASRNATGLPTVRLSAVVRSMRIRRSRTGR